MYAQVCSTKESLTLDGSVKKVAPKVFKNLQQSFPLLTWSKRFRSPNHQAGCEPDGGVFYYKDEVILAAEGKHQQNAGNAIERWYKNNFVLRLASPKMTYITFATGQGAKEDAVISKTLSPAHPDGFNTYVVGGNVCYLEPNGFDEDDIYEIIKEAITDQILLR